MTPIQLNPKSTAVLIRAQLRAAFPATKFSVVIGRGSGVSSLTVKWTDGPTVSRVEQIIDRFQCGSFDGMTDCYDYARGVDAMLIVDGKTYKTGTRYVFTNRCISPKLANRCIAAIVAYWGGKIETVPVAVAGYAGFKLEGDIGRQAIRADLDSYRHDWFSSIYRCANDRTEFTRDAL